MELVEKFPICKLRVNMEEEISVLQREVVLARKAVTKLRTHCEAGTDQRDKIFRLLDKLRLQQRQLDELESEISTLRPAVGRQEISDQTLILGEAKMEKLVLLKELSDLEISNKEISASLLKMAKIGNVGVGLDEVQLESEISAVKFDCDQLKLRDQDRGAEMSAQISALERELAQLRSAGDPTTAASSRERLPKNFLIK